jgi:lipase chaperone LimK
LAAVLLFSSFYYFQNKDSKTHSSQLTPSSSLTLEKEIAKSDKHLEYQVTTVNQDSPPQPNFVKTYQGTQPDGAIHLDEKGDVIIDKDLKRLFDYYLSAIGELPLDQMRKYLQQFAGEKLNPIQLQQLLDYFDKYHDYLNKADLFSQDIGDDLTLQKKMQLLSEFRADSLGSEMANAFFADEQDYIEFVMTEKNNDKFDGQQKEWLQAENQATKFQDVVLENREFNKADNINSTEVNQYRIEKYGQAAADRLSQLDQQRAQWQAVVDEYFQQRKQVEIQQHALSLEQLNANYTPNEIRRLEALWRIGNL